MTSRISDNWTFTGICQFLGNVVFQSEVIGSDNVKTGANISADKLTNRTAAEYNQASGGDVATQTRIIHIARAAGSIKSIEIRPETAPTGGDKQFTVDVQKAANGSGSFSSLLSAAETVDSSSVDNTRQQASLVASPALADGDALRVVITASGTTGSQGQGVHVTVNIDEQGA